MTKRPSLADSMRKKLEPVAPARPAAIEETPTHSPAAARPKAYFAATRTGLKKVTAGLDPEAHKRFRMLTLDLDKTGEELLTEAVSDLFVKYGKSPIT